MTVLPCLVLPRAISSLTVHRQKQFSQASARINERVTLPYKISPAHLSLCVPY